MHLSRKYAWKSLKKKYCFKEKIKRTRLRNKILKDRNVYNKREFKAKELLCLLLENPKSYITVILMKKKVADNKALRKTIKPFLSDKIVSRQKLTLIEEDENVESNINTSQILNTFFSNIVSNLKIAEYVNCDPISDNINDPVVKSIVKYRNHPNILKIGELCNRKQCFLFSFSHVDK